MSLLESLAPKKGSTHRAKLLGRGPGSGRGKTAGKGHKGQKARAGGAIRWGFEGGQTPLYRRTPKRGFKNIGFRNRFDIVNLTQLEKFSGDVTPEVLKKAGLIDGRLPLKILGLGEVKSALNVKAQKFSESAKKAIEAAGGQVEVLTKAK